MKYYITTRYDKCIITCIAPTNDNIHLIQTAATTHSRLAAKVYFTVYRICNIAILHDYLFFLIYNIRKKLQASSAQMFLGPFVKTL